jgi:hypothetical protein
MNDYLKIGFLPQYSPAARFRRFPVEPAPAGEIAGARAPARIRTPRPGRRGREAQPRCEAMSVTSGQAASLSEIVETGSGQSIPKAGSSWRTPPSTPGV